MDVVNISVKYTPGDKYIVVNLGETTQQIEASYIEKIINGFSYTFYNTNLGDLRHPWQLAKFGKNIYDSHVMSYADYIDDAIISLTNLKITMLTSAGVIVAAIITAIKDGKSMDGVIAIAVSTTSALGGLYYEQMCARQIAQALFYANYEYGQIR